MGFVFAMNTSEVNHLFFANDLILFFKATYREVGRVKEVLRLFGIASCQAVNYDKSMVSFGENVAGMGG